MTPRWWRLVRVFFRPGSFILTIALKVAYNRPFGYVLYTGRREEEGTHNPSFRKGVKDLENIEQRFNKE